MTADWLFPALRFAQYSVLLGLFGSLTFRLLGLRSLAAPPPATGPATLIAAVVAPLIVAAVMLVAIADMMGQALWDLDWTTSASLVVTTDMGTAFLARTALTGAAAVSLMLVRPVRRSHTIACWLYALALMTLAWNGHAAATEGLAGLVHRINNGLHLTAAGLWIGAIMRFTAEIIDAHRRHDPVMDDALLSEMHSFRPFGLLLVGIVAFTGIINAQMIFGLEKLDLMLRTPYGWMLGAKIVVVALMLGCAAYHANKIRQQLAGNRDTRLDQRPLISAIRLSLVTEMLLALGVIGLAAVIGLSSPFD